MTPDLLNPEFSLEQYIVDAVARETERLEQEAFDKDISMILYGDGSAPPEGIITVKGKP